MYVDTVLRLVGYNGAKWFFVGRMECCEEESESVVADDSEEVTVEADDDDSESTDSGPLSDNAAA